MLFRSLIFAFFGLLRLFFLNFFLFYQFNRFELLFQLHARNFSQSKLVSFQLCFDLLTHHVDVRVNKSPSFLV